MTKRKQEKVVWEPQPGSQVKFLSATPIFEVLYEGTRGGGKTDCLIMSFCNHVGQGHGAAWKGILFRQTYKQLGDVISKTKKWIWQIWPQAKFNASENYWEWPGGERLLLRQFMKEDDYWNYHGHEYPWIGWEELCNWPTDSGYKRMLSCCRSSTPGMPRMIRATTNPYGPGHAWVKLRFRLPASRGKVQRDNLNTETGYIDPPRLAIHSSIYENKILLEADPNYIQNIAAAARNESERKAWLEGSWDVVAGGMFDSVWDSKYNVVEPFAIPSNWRILRSFDWGESRPFSVGWWAVSTGEDLILTGGHVKSTIRGDLYRVKEWYGWTGKPNEGQRLLASEIAEGIVQRELQWRWRRPKENWCRVRGGVADSQIFSSENGMCIATDMKSKVRLDDGHRYPGISWMPADKRAGSRIAGWSRMRQMLKNAHPSPQGMREKPGMFVTTDCEQFIRTVPVLPRDDKDQDDVNTEAEDHTADETRYLARYVQVKTGSGTSVGLT
jgi:hypothetical protein